ncbi:unnamed protein product [Mytilus coruscus]|uniref:VWFA domain-containing protein n=1 Tax=Mytilus coruscus TaxID=42192 RepID=A0A6J8EME9_MYTCO|nr:unnamed protein product [Mytilus coruscus]CAC5421537.1 unnamed protein product [Mytilus coruscus]
MTPGTTPIPINKLLTTGDFGLAKFDLVIILDSSTSVREENYDTMKQFTKDLLANSDIDGGNVRVGVASFSMRGSINFQLKDYRTKKDVFNAIDKIQYIYGSTNTADAIRLMRADMFTAENGDRPDVKNIAIIITDGVSNINSQTTIPEAEKARDVGIHLYTIGIGLSNLTELNGMASVPAKDNSFNVQSFDELKGLAKIFPSKRPALLSTTTSIVENTADAQLSTTTSFVESTADTGIPTYVIIVVTTLVFMLIAALVVIVVVCYKRKRANHSSSRDIPQNQTIEQRGLILQTIQQ